ncbi:MAG: hypothetical protein A3F43_04110 [Gammaproteobacteria bacterium RIFCSPHIGHO2_12_FULL_42_10]|nr:MAG: hypothetical protein A3F43_04110 [Gammaproteobacteria bacterium RIFCSPHIGHO2_12_FULL_42_10]
MTQKISSHAFIHLSINVNHRNNVFEHIQNGIMITNCESKVVYTNPAFSRITGYSAAEMLGNNPGILHSGRHDKKFYEEMWKSINEKGYWEGEIWNRKKTGEIFPEFITISTLINIDEYVCNYIAISSDITSFKLEDLRNLTLAFYDPLTGLPNRSLYHDRVSHALDNAKLNPNSKHTILFMDLDHFKQVNDTYGHLVGDHLLKIVGQRLSSLIRAGDTVARVGGDEFTAVLHGDNDKATVKKLAERIVENIEKPFEVDGHKVNIAISIGISFYPDDAKQLDDLLAKADEAMYDAKKTKRKIQFYDELA